jgi:hypothetical protein
MGLRPSGGYDTERVRFRLGKTDDKRRIRSKSCQYITVFVIAAVRIVIVFFPQGVKKSGNRLDKADLMLFEVKPVLLFVPYEIHDDLLLYRLVYIYKVVNIILHIFPNFPGPTR